MKTEIKNICCIGAGFVGGPTMSVIANNCSEIQINVVDINQERINLWNSKDLKNLPIYEPGLDKIIQKCRGINLHFSTEVEKSIALADMVFISVNTPTKRKGIGAGQASDLKWVEASARQVAKYATGHTIVVEKSTLPVKTAEVIKDILESAKLNQNKDCEINFDVLSNPEFLAEGTAINDLENPDRVLIGGDSNDAIMTLSYIYEKWVPKDRILYTNIWSSELAKLTSNAFLAQRISSINSIAAICEATGADIREVSRAIGSDTRIGSKFLDSSPGFGGSCFKKDILNLVYLSKYFGLYNVAKFWEGVVILNNWHQHRISELVVQKLYGTISGKKIAILGFAFKANTNDTRESAAITICKDLIEEGALLAIHDPKVDSKQIGKDLNIEEFDYKNNNRNFEGGWLSVRNFVDAFEDADAAIFLTEWDLYKIINWKEVSIKMRKPAWIFDSRSIFEPKDIVKEGLKLWRIGDGCPYKK
tara:strand:- start:933 stop:2363 length:1431 start_codon:yes stop_codon:yes gene_type:complete